MAITEMVIINAGILQEDVRERGDQKHDHADKQKLAHSGQIPLDARCERGHGKENHRCAAEGQCDQVAAVLESQNGAKHA